MASMKGNPFSRGAADIYGKGNINLYNRPKYKNPDGSVSTVRSVSYNIDNSEVLIPTVRNGKTGAEIMSNEDALQHYFETGEHLGKFKTVKEANKYADWLHNQQQAFIKIINKEVRYGTQT